MNKRIVTYLLCTAMTASMISGCGLADKLGETGKENGTTDAQADTGDDFLSIIDKNKTSEADNAKEAKEDTVADATEEPSESTGEATDSEEETSETVESKVSYKWEAPSFRITRKSFSQKYDGDAKFDESNENSKDYSNGVLYEGDFAFIYVDEESAAKYPALYKNINEAAEKSFKFTEDSVEETIKDAKEQYETSAKEGYSYFGPYYDHCEITVKRADNTVVSIYDWGDNYMGGAHGMYGAGGTNYDAQTGELLDISDVIDVTKEELDEIIKKKLLETQEYDNQFVSLDENLKDYKFNPVNDSENNIFELGYKWYFAHDGLHIIFNVYELASYADGMQDIVIGYTEYPGTIKDKFIPASNAPDCQNGNLMFVKEGKDSDMDYLHFRYTPLAGMEEYDDWIYAESFELVLNGKSAKADTGFNVPSDYNFETYKITTMDGKEYVYYINPTDNDYCELLVFDITGGDVKYVGRQHYHYFEDFDYEKGTETEPLYSNPYNMHFGSVGDAFGTYTCYTSYEVGDDGMPVQISDEYKFSWKTEDAVSTAEIKGDEVDENGKVINAGVTILAGTHFVPLRTDEKTYMDFTIDGGKIIRLTYTSFDYPAALPEGNIDDLFEGLIYAG